MTTVKRSAGVCLLLILLGGMTACATIKAPVSARQAPDKQPVSVSSSRTERRGTSHTQHTVTRGDTLYSIAWRYGYDYKTLASWNRIKSPFTIYPGQVIKLGPAPRSRPQQAPPGLKKQPAKPVAATRKSTPPVKTASATGAGTGAVRWQWPARGKLLKSSTPTAKKGISIAGRAGQKIVAAATGKVVYSGSGLRGYGNLIIIKHNDIYLSAYAHNRDMVVKEGDTVRAGQQISTMGVDGKGAPTLHFEIRKNGKPIDPLGQLPRS